MNTPKPLKRSPRQEQLDRIETKCNAINHKLEVLLGGHHVLAADRALKRQQESE